MLQLSKDFVKPGCHAHVFCFSIQFFFWIEAVRAWRTVDSAIAKELSTGSAEESVLDRRERPSRIYEICATSRNLREKLCLISI